MGGPYLSLIFPAYNEQSRLPSTLEKVAQFLAAQPYSAEVLVVENGSTDRTLEIAQDSTRFLPSLRVFHEEGRGKGLAVRRGMLEARGEYRFFLDTDLSMPIEEVNRFIPPLGPDAEITIASREAPGAARFGEPAYRHVIGRVFNTMVRLLALPGLNDTQCGFKCFNAKTAEEIFPHQTITGWTFDVEVLFIARKRGYRIIEIPIPWYFNPQSKVHPLRDSLQMGLDLFQIRWNYTRGKYQ